jgi:hypothetical protein
MEEEHILNESLNRLEPTSKICGFCENGNAESMENCCFLYVYHVSDRTNIIVYRDVTYTHFQIGIPRCYNCTKIHYDADKIRLGSYFAICLLFVFAIAIFKNSILMVIGLAALILLIVRTFLKDYFIKKNKILTLEEAAYKDELIGSLLRGGCTLKKPEA